MKSKRIFYSTAAALIFVIMLIGFWPFYTSGHGPRGRIINPAIFPVVLVHGMAITAWYLLSLVQSLLITVKNRRLHMQLGWSAVVIALIVAVSGVMAAVRSAVRLGNVPFFGMAYYPEILLIMLAEIGVFTLFVAAGLLLRKQPEKHRAMMLLASLSLLMGATSRIPFLVSHLGGYSSLIGHFGPVFVLAAIFLLVRYLMTRTFDRWFAAGYAFMAIIYLAAEQLSRTAAWRHLADQWFKS